MTCSRYPQMLSLFLDQELSGRETAEVESHLDECPRCRALLEHYRLQGSRLRGHLNAHALGEDFIRKVLSPEIFQIRAAGHEPAAPSRTRWQIRWLQAAAAIFAAVIVFSQFFSTFNLYLNTEYGLRENRIGTIWAVNTILIVLIEMVLIHALRRRSEMKIIALGAALIGIGYGLLPFGRGFGYAAFTVVVWTMGEILTMPLTATVTASRAGASAGRYMGVLSLTFSLAWFIAPFSGNWLYATIGGDALWTLVGGVGLLTAAGIWALRGALAVPKPPRGGAGR